MSIATIGELRLVRSGPSLCTAAAHFLCVSWAFLFRKDTSDNCLSVGAMFVVRRTCYKRSRISCQV